MQDILNKQVDLNLLSKYNYILDERDIRHIRYTINTKGLIESIEYYLDELDVSKHPAMQTIHFAYSSVISSLYYCLDLLIKDSVNLYLKHTYLNKLLNIHKANLKYEVINPPIIYEKRKKSATKTNNKVSSEKTIRTPKPQKDNKSKSRLTIINLETNKTVTLDRDLALSVVKDKPFKFKIKDD